ncbi:MAG: mechanosensitive ion channel domain-containing protein [Candidatus Woesearchaeota archaeon]
MRRILTFLGLGIIVIIAFMAAIAYPGTTSKHIYSSVLIIFLVYGILNVIIGTGVRKVVKEKIVRYTANKIISVLFIAISLLLVLRVWFHDSTALALSFGVIGAGVAVALQDVFKSFAGGITIITTQVYRVGDRVQINEFVGDVVDIGILYTTMMEIGNWIGGDQATGRIASIPNSRVLSVDVKNYTKDHVFIWDEIKIPLTYDSDWKIARDKVKLLVSELTSNFGAQAKQNIMKMDDKYYLQSHVFEPVVFVALTDNWIDMRVRYVVAVRERRQIRSQIQEGVLEFVTASKGRIKVASQTMNLSVTPPGISEPIKKKRRK